MNGAKYPSVTAVVNLKGGVGKTTLCTNLAYGISYFHNKRVLLIDLDPQANATQYLLSQYSYKAVYLADPPEKLTVYELFKEYREKQDLPRAQRVVESPEIYTQRVYTGRSGFFDIMASKLELSFTTFYGGDLIHHDQIKWFIDSVSDNYDHILIDCPPTVSKMLMAGLEASEFVFIPVKPDFLSTIGLPLIHRLIDDVYPDKISRRKGEPLYVLGVVFTLNDARLRMTRESTAEVYKVAKEFGYNVFDYKMSQTTKYAWSSKMTLPIFRTEPSSKYALEMRGLVDEYLDAIAEAKRGRNQ